MKKLTAFFLASMASLCVSAEKWIDVTDSYVKNPRYDNDDKSYWMGTALGAYNPKENAEHYQKTYNTYQQLSGLPAGKYRVGLNAFYRMGSSADDYSLYTSGNYSNSQHAKLYATSSISDYETGIAPLASGKLKEGLGGNTSGVGQQTGNNWWYTTYEYYVPDNMEAANNWFEAGYYQNYLECEVGEDGNLTIGIRKYTTLNGDWTCIDNWTLEYWGNVKNVESITFDSEELGLTIGEIYRMKPIIEPNDATYQNLTWTVSNTRIATVDDNGNVTAKNIGKAVLTATATDGSGVKGRITLNVYKSEPSGENIIINEIMAANVDVYLDPNQNYGSWVELYNPTDRSVNIGGLYVSDDANNLKKHKLVDNYGCIPAHGYCILNFDHHEVWTEMSYRQIDDKLDCDGGTIIISDGTNIFASQDYPQAIGRVSYARTSDGADTWGNAGIPTPCASNANGSFASEQLDAPVIDKNAQLFNGNMQICVNIPDGATLRFTTDGSSPTLTNGETSATGLFSISSTTTFRFRLFKDGYLPSQVVTRSYIENNGNEPFPIISIVTAPDNIYSADHGAFSKGEYGRPGNGQTTKCNWNMDWDHPVSFEYITTDNECVISQECDFSMCGGWSRAYEPHSFKLKASKTYDLNNSFDYQFFDTKPGLKHKTLQVRNGGNDTSCRIKDAAIQGIIASSGLYVDNQAWQPAHVYINGKSYNVLNIREPNNKHHAYSNYGIDSEEMEQFEMSPDSGYVQMEGTGEYFTKWYELSQNAEYDDVYEEIKKIVDIDEYANYMACELYSGNWDWPQNNVKGFRDMNDGKFHFVLFDLDGSLNTSTPFTTFTGKQNYTFDTLHGYDYSTDTNVEGTRIFREIEFVTIFLNMLKNDEFRKQFIDAFCIVNGSVFSPSRVSEIVNGMADYLSTGNYVNPWRTANDIINAFSANRQNDMITQLRSFEPMQLNSYGGQRAAISSNIDEGQILLNGHVIPTGKLEGTLFSPITLKAVAPAGFKFLGWSQKNTTSASVTFDMGSRWKYNDSDNLDGIAWTSSDYSDSKWKEGMSPIGYGKSTAATITSSNHPTYYFRKSVKLASSPKSSDVFTLDYTIDDGMIVYVNGVEAGRYNMPYGNVSYNDVATTYANDNPDKGTMTLDAKLFQKGNNVIAVEVHNNNVTSSDILWDARLSIEADNSDNMEYVSNDQEYTCPSAGSLTLIAVWEEMTEEEMIAEGLNTTPVVVNEISAANSVYVNDYFKKNDWIELHNTTGKALDIAGLYISDNTKKPVKYQVPADDVKLNTVIPAHGYKVIWCDKLDNKSDVIHTTFKLDAEGGEVMILKFNGDSADPLGDGSQIAYTDTLRYNAHLGQQSFGRYPDAGVMTYILDKPTPGAANIYTMYAVEYEEPEMEEPEPDGIVILRDGGMTMAYVNGVVNIKDENANINSFSIFNASGMKVTAETVRNTGSFVTVSVSSLPHGVYVASATDTDGNSCMIKFIVK